ncbi:hypothetical protein HK101_006778, partial [Irineochytrium annulatum]
MQPTSFIDLPSEVWRRVALHLIADDDALIPVNHGVQRNTLLHLAHCSGEAVAVFSSPAFDGIWRAAFRQRWGTWVQPQRRALGYDTGGGATTMNEVGNRSGGMRPHAVYALTQSGLLCPVCGETTADEVTAEEGLGVKDCGHDLQRNGEPGTPSTRSTFGGFDGLPAAGKGCRGCKAKQAATLRHAVISNPYIPTCPCCPPTSTASGLTNAKLVVRAARLAKPRAWTCPSLLDPITDRLFCSRLCGDASAQVECDREDCDDHGCAACVGAAGGNVRRAEEGSEAAKDASVRRWVCGGGGGEEEELNSDDDLDDDDDDDEGDTVVTTERRDKDGK